MKSLTVYWALQYQHRLKGVQSHSRSQSQSGDPQLILCSVPKLEYKGPCGAWPQTLKSALFSGPGLLLTG